jgi:hypothetical protein
MIIRPVTAKARVHAPDSLRGICDGQSGTGTGFSSEFLRFLPINTTSPRLHNHMLSGAWPVGCHS